MNQGFGTAQYIQRGMDNGIFKKSTYTGSEIPRLDIAFTPVVGQSSL